MEPLLSVVTITYNHEPYIAKCIEGVLMQKVNFPIEFILAEDCSTDNTREICKEYAHKYPDIIHLIISESNVGYKENELRAMKAARGKYIAFCEGDDYWTYPLKLQTQVDFLETHSDYNVCFHRCRHYNDIKKTYQEDLCKRLFTDETEGVDISLTMFFEKWITQPLTMVYKRNAIALSLYDDYKYYRDMHQIYHLLKSGRGFIFPFIGGIRNIHDGGIASRLSLADQCRNGVNIAAELYYKNRDNATKSYYESMLQWYLYNINQIKEKRIEYSLELFRLTHNYSTLFHNLFR